MSRATNWPAKLALFLDEKRNQPFEWAGNNCCFFACDWLAILTGSDPAESYRSRITSALSAARVLSEDGGVEGIAERICAERGWPEQAVKQAQRGDVVIFDYPDGPALGVCAGGLSWFAGSAGAESVKTLQCRRAWRI